MNPPETPPDPPPLAAELFELGAEAMRAAIPPAKPTIMDTSKWDAEYLIRYYNRPGGYSGD